MGISTFGDRLSCYYCCQIKKVKAWPMNGDNMPFYCQDEPGNYALKVTCSHCGKHW